MNIPTGGLNNLQKKLYLEVQESLNKLRSDDTRKTILKKAGLNVLQIGDQKVVNVDTNGSFDYKGSIEPMYMGERTVTIPNTNVSITFSLRALSSPSTMRDIVIRKIEFNNGGSKIGIKNVGPSVGDKKYDISVGAMGSGEIAIASYYEDDFNNHGKNDALRTYSLNNTNGYVYILDCALRPEKSQAVKMEFTSESDFVAFKTGLEEMLTQITTITGTYNKELHHAVI